MWLVAWLVSANISCMSAECGNGGFHFGIKGLEGKRAGLGMAGTWWEMLL
jgi:hypothetical protein